MIRMSRINLIRPIAVIMACHQTMALMNGRRTRLSEKSAQVTVTP
jgi:hypothetical protein